MTLRRGPLSISYIFRARKLTHAHWIPPQHHTAHERPGPVGLAPERGPPDPDRCGGGVQTSIDTPSDGAWFEVNRSRYGDNEWRFRTAATSSQAQVKTGVTVSNLRWYRMRIDWAPDGDAVTGSIYCSGSLISTVATRTYVSNAGSMSPGIYTVKNLGAAARSTDVDYMYTLVTFTGSRV